jgi:hypothetical protein
MPKAKQQGDRPKCLSCGVVPVQRGNGPHQVTCPNHHISLVHKSCLKRDPKCHCGSELAGVFSKKKGLYEKTPLTSLRTKKRNKELVELLWACMPGNLEKAANILEGQKLTAAHLRTIKDKLKRKNFSGDKYSFDAGYQYPEEKVEEFMTKLKTVM